MEHKRSGTFSHRERPSKVRKSAVLTEIPPVLSSNTVKLQKEYFEKFQQLLQYELQDQAAESQKRLTSWDKRRLEKEGNSIFDLRVKEHSPFLKEFVVQFVCKEEGELPRHRLTHGDMVSLSHGHESSTPVEGTILDHSKVHISIAIGSLPKDLESHTWRIDKTSNRVTFDRQVAALKTITSYSNSGGTIMRDVILGICQKPEVWAKGVPSPNLRSFFQGPFPEDFSDWRLNPSQRSILRAALGRRLTLIQGPPGTGKTHTAVQWVRTVIHFLRKRKQRGLTQPGLEPRGARQGGLGQGGLRQGGVNYYPRILCTADTNVAVDNLLEGLSDCGIRALRLGKPVKIREEFVDRSLEAQVLGHPKYRQKLNDFRLSNSSDETSLREIEKKLSFEILQSAEVVCATCVGSGHEMLDDFQFEIVVIDEATQATEPSSIVPLVKRCEQLVLLGDHFQLPPTVTSSRAAEGGLSTSLFQRLVTLGVEPLLLDTQYRMHPGISHFPSKTFYNGRLKDGIDSSAREHPKGFPWPNKEIPVAFVNVEGNEETSPFAGSSKQNRQEAEVVLRIVEDFLTKGKLSPKQIGIISPYNGQVKILKDSLEAKGGLGPQGRYRKLNVNSVDGYQGREKDVIVLSTVRANAKGRVGFLKDWRRLNVAVTRAREGLVVVGHAATLRNDEHWNLWLNWVEDKKLQVTSDESLGKEQSTVGDEEKVKDTQELQSKSNGDATNQV